MTGAGRWLGLAASPTFAAMAIVTAVGGGPAAAICGAAGASPLTGMAAMYTLMSLFHVSPWLRLGSVRRSPSIQRRSSH